MKRLSLWGLAGAGLLAVPVRAQTTLAWGPRLGGVAATHRYSGRDRPGESHGYRPGLEAGLLAQLGRGHWALQTGLLYTAQGTVVRRATTHVYAIPTAIMPVGAFYPFHARLHYLALPLSVAYAPRSTGEGWQLSAGPYLAWLLGGDHTRPAVTGRNVSVYQEPLTPVWSAAPDAARTYVHRLDAGVQLGLGYRRGPVLAQAAFRHGLRSVTPQYVATGQFLGDRPFYNAAVHGSLTFLFGPKT
ncbi:MAG TPA: porin family protein [Hymenobacter sp.]|jgi:hypothetical protein